MIKQSIIFKSSPKHKDALYFEFIIMLIIKYL